MNKTIMDDFLKVLVVAAIIMIVLATIITWIISCKEASIFNRINKENFTCSDFFWASDQINSQTQTIKVR